MERRCKLDIIVAILDAVSRGTTKTKIMYATNLNSSLVNKYLNLLQENELLELNNNVYKITEKGKEYLENASELQIWLTVRQVHQF